MVAADVPSAVEGGILPPGKKREWFMAIGEGLMRLGSREVFSVGRDAPLYGRQDACRYVAAFCSGRRPVCRRGRHLAARKKREWFMAVG